MANYKININSVKRNLLTPNKTLKTLAANSANRKFVASKNKLLEDFDDHKVTKEIAAGANANNVTESLPDGNLYGFIGFSESDPISPLREVIEETITINLSSPKTDVDGNKFLYSFNVKTPSKSSIEAATPMPKEWSSGSWATKIEKVISGLEYYLFSKKKKNSRSGAGIQSKGGKVREEKFNGVDYLTGLFRKFKERLQR
jgi:hypothetical protein